MENELISDISAVERDIETFLLHSGFVGPDGILNESCYPQRKYFTHESYAGSPRFPHEGWYRRESDGGNPNAMTYGFAISEFVRQFLETQDEERLRIAEKLADYILKYQILDPGRRTFGGFGSGELLNDSAHQLPYALLRLARVSSRGTRYLESAMLCVNNFVLNHHCQCDANGEPTGIFFDFFSEERNRFESWSKPERCAHSPLCFAFTLFAAYAETGDKRCLNAVLRAYDWLIQAYRGEVLSAANGIVISPENEPFRILGLCNRQTVPRYTGYLIHTLLGAWYFSGGEERYLNEAVRCGERILEAQRPDGSFPLTSEIERYFPNTANDAFGYLGGTLHLLAQAAGDNRFENAARRAVAALRLDQCRNPEMEQFGGIFRKGGASVPEGMVHPFGYNWVVDGFQTLLNLQGVMLLQEKESYLGGTQDIQPFFEFLRHGGKPKGNREDETIR